MLIHKEEINVCGLISILEGTWSKNVRIKGRNSKTYVMIQDVSNNGR